MTIYLDLTLFAPSAFFGAALSIWPDLTILTQLAFFLASYWMLKTWFLPPVLEVIKRRETMIENANAELRKYDAEGQQMAQDYQQKLRAARVKAQEIHNELRKEANEYERTLLEKTRVESANKLYEGEAKLEVQRQQALEQLDKQTQELSDQIVEKVLGRSLSS